MGYQKQHPGVLMLTAFSGSLDEDTRTPKIMFQTATVPKGFTLMRQ